MRLVGETDVGFLQAAVPLHPHAVRAIHEDVADAGIVPEGFERAQTVDLVQDLSHHRLAQFAGKSGRLRRTNVDRKSPQLGAKLALVERRRLVQVDCVDNPAMQDRFQPLKRLAVVDSYLRCGNHGVHCVAGYVVDRRFVNRPREIRRSSEPSL